MDMSRKGSPRVVIDTTYKLKCMNGERGRNVSKPRCGARSKAYFTNTNFISLTALIW